MDSRNNIIKKKSKLRNTVILIIIVVIILIAFYNKPVYAVSSRIEINYFYLSACGSCHDTELFLSSISEMCYPQLLIKDEKLIINKYNTVNGENINLLKEFYKKYNVSEKDRSMPIIFVGKKYIQGEQAIKLNIKYEVLNTSPGKSLINVADYNDKGSVLKDFQSFKVVSAFFIGFANGLTPCSLSMLLFFASLVMAKNINLLKMGIAYCLGKFITYFLLGTLLYRVLATINLEWFKSATKVIMIFMIIVFIFLNLNDYFAAKNEKYNKIKLQLPVPLRKFNHNWLRVISKVKSEKSMLGMSLALGIITSFGEFLCTGQIYLTTILYVLNNEAAFNARSLVFFLLYNFAFILPPLIVTVILFKGKEMFEVSEMVRKRMDLIKLINIIVFLIFAVLIFRII